MKKIAMGTLCLSMVACFAAVALAQPGPRGTSSVTIKGKTVSVEYGRPSLRGRTTDELLGKLPAGSFWRLGSNESTTFKTDIDLTAVNVTNEYALYSFLSTFSGTHYVTPRALTAKVTFNF